MRRGGLTFIVLCLLVLPGCGVQFRIGNNDGAKKASWLSDLERHIRNENVIADKAYARMQHARSNTAFESAARDRAESARRLFNEVYSMPTPAGCQSIRDEMVHYLKDDLQTFRRFGRGVGLDHRAKILDGLHGEWAAFTSQARMTLSRGGCT